MKTSSFEMWLFYHQLPFAMAALEAGVTGLVLDWENRHKHERQNGFDTQINSHTEKDLYELRKNTHHPIICRINAVHSTTPEEIEKALDGDVTEILVPMVRTKQEVESVLNFVRDRCRVGILIETCDAVEIADSFSDLPLSRIYIGLNDLRIDRIRNGISTPSLFTPLLDGTIERMRDTFGGQFGFAGLTLPDKGQPIPCHLLMGEMARLRCSFSFLRRSFIADASANNMRVSVQTMRDTLDHYLHAEDKILEGNRIKLHSLVRGL